MWLALLTTAWGAEPAEEVIVWGDRFARWERRWFVETEVAFPGPISLPALQNLQLYVHTIQIRAVLSCDKDFVLGRHQWEVHCDIEDIGLQSLTEADHVDRPQARVLDEIDATLTGARVQLQVSDRGGVPNVDLEGVDAINEEGRQRAEALRQLMMRVILPFHLQLPDTIHDGVQWYASEERLFAMPSSQGSVGAQTVAHYLNRVGDHFVVQSLGKSTVYPTGSMDGLGSLGFVAGANLPPPGEGGMLQAISLPVDAFELELHSVAIFDPNTGILGERVWSVAGNHTASSLSTLKPRGYAYAGRYRILSETERPHVGRTQVVGPDDWVPFTP